MDRFKQLEDSMVLGPQPTEQDLQQAKHQSIKTVIDSRLPSETPTPNADLASRNGLDYVSISVNKASLSGIRLTNSTGPCRKKGDRSSFIAPVAHVQPYCLCLARPRKTLDC